jgi:hypothetical protein
MPGGYVVRDANDQACPIFLHHLMGDFGTDPAAFLLDWLATNLQKNPAV